MAKASPELKATSVIVSEITPAFHCQEHKIVRKIPLVLRKKSLFVLNSCLVVLSVGITTLWYLSKGVHGFNIDNANHYVLAYGPTVLFVWVVAAWRQIDYHIKAYAPWEELRGGPTTAQKSVLLDYISVFQAVAFWNALRNKHFTVVVTTIGFVLLKVATLASTGMFVLGQYELEQWIATTLNTTVTAEAVDVANKTTTSDQSLLYTTYGVLSQGLEKPFGLGNGLAYSTFSLPRDVTNSSNLTIQLGAFVPSFDCLPVNVSITLGPANTSETNPEVDYQIDSSSCTLLDGSPSLHTLNPSLFRCPERQLSGWIQNINCTSSVLGSGDGVYKLLLMADMRYTQELNTTEQSAALSDPVQASAWSTEIASSAALVCRLGYGIHNVTATAAANRLTSIEISRNSTASARQLSSLSNEQLDALFRGALTASDGMLGSRLDEGYALEYPDPAFKMMSAVLNGTYADLLDTTKMHEAASLVSTQLAAQIAHQYLRQNASEPANLLGRSAATRVMVTSLSTFVVVSALLGTLGLSIALGVLRRHASQSHYPASIEDSVTLIRANDQLSEALEESQKCTEAQLNSALQTSVVLMEGQPDGVHEIQLERTMQNSLPRNASQPWWHPITVSWIAVSLSLALAAGTIVVLEVLQRKSDSERGFVAVHLSSDEAGAIYTHLAPALVFLLLASMFNCLDFNVLLLAPFHAMRNPQPLNIVEERSLLGRPPILALLKAVRTRRVAAVVSTSATLVGSLMTIVVSGLYNIRSVHGTFVFDLQSLDKFEPTWVNSLVDDGGAAVTSTLTENLDFPYPLGTYKELAYSKSALSDKRVVLSNTSFTVNLPTWRAHLLCTTLPASNFSVMQYQTYVQNMISVNATYGLPPECILGGPNGTSSLLQFGHAFSYPSAQNSSYFGKFLDIHVGPFDPVLGAAEGETNMVFTANDNPLGCPSVALIYGFSGLDQSTGSVAVDVCYQQLQKAETNFTFQDASFTIDKSKEPAINSSSIQYILQAGNSTEASFVANDATNLSYRPQNHFDNTFAIFNTTNNNPFSGPGRSSSPVDPFFQGVFFGRYPISLQLLSLVDDSQRTSVQQGILSFYRRYMAQVIGLKMRQPLSRSGADQLPKRQASAGEGQVTRRIFQNKASKIVLQWMLGFMIICALVVLATIRMHRLLPACANPCTVWGQISIWIGSDYARHIAHEETSLSIERALSSDRHEAWVQLGWWTKRNGKERYGIDVKSGPR